MPEERFWLVLKDSFSLRSTVRHNSREEAMKEAARLAQNEQGVKFYVAAVTGYAEFPPQPVQGWHELQKPKRTSCD